MKKLTALFLAIAMCMTLGVPALASTPESINTMGTVDPEDLSLIEPETPDGYTLKYTLEEDTVWDVAYKNAENGLFIVVSAIIGNALPVTAAFTSQIVYTLQQLGTNELPGTVTEYIYECDDPMEYLYPYIYWHKFECVIELDKDHTVTYYTDYFEYPVLPR